MEFKNKLKLLRIENNISQQQLADVLFISRSMIAKYETGTALPTIETIEKIANYFHVEISALMDCPNEVGIPYNYFRIFMVFHNVLYWLGLITCSSFIIFSFLPLFGEENIIIGANKIRSPLVIIAIVHSIMCLISLLVWKYALKTAKIKMIVSIFTDFSLLIDTFLVFIAIVVGIGGTQVR